MERNQNWRDPAIEQEAEKLLATSRTVRDVSSTQEQENEEQNDDKEEKDDESDPYNKVGPTRCQTHLRSKTQLVRSLEKIAEDTNGPRQGKINVYLYSIQ